MEGNYERYKELYGVDGHLNKYGCSYPEFQILSKLKLLKGVLNLTTYVLQN